VAAKDQGGPRCPTCGAAAPSTPPAAGERSPFPFCTDRCRLIDLGRWLDGDYRLPALDDGPSSEGDDA
jgi:endogenous inhibitor of DNA gyrase (YacG/DUF329 family)